VFGLGERPRGVGYHNLGASLVVGKNSAKAYIRSIGIEVERTCIIRHAEHGSRDKQFVELVERVLLLGGALEATCFRLRPLSGAATSGKPGMKGW